MTFDEKINEILEKHKHIPKNNWQTLCFAMFLDYQSEVINKEFYRERNLENMRDAVTPPTKY